jgi:hypothetical protein
MEEKSLSIAFGDSLKEESISCISEYAEIGLDAVMEDGILKDIPIVSTAVALYKIGDSIKERHNLKKLLVFLNELNNGIVDDQKRKDYQQKFQSNEKFRNKEIEYLLVLIDRYINYDKPKMLAKLYLAYLDGTIIWEELTMYAEVIDRFLLLDCNFLISESETYKTYRNIGVEPILRLVALGLMAEESSNSLFTDDGRGGFAVTTASMERAKLKEKRYKKTEFGEKLATILR